MVFAYFSMLPYRTVSGGFHLHTQLGCIIGSIIFYYGNVLLSRFIVLNSIEKYILVALSFLSVSYTHLDVYKRQAVIGVGAATEVEMKDRKLRIEDALSATKAAVEEGIVAGGGTAFVNIIPDVQKAVAELHGDEKIGGKIILRALEEPVRQIAANAGLEPAVILEKVKTS